jgi:hypothetical protein
VDTGPRTFTVTDDMFRLLGGLRGDWGAFNWESALTYSWARTDDNTHDAISNTLFQRALAKSTPDAYNPFNGGSQPAFSLGDATPSNRATIESFLVEVHRISKPRWRRRTSRFPIRGCSIFRPGASASLPASKCAARRMKTIATTGWTERSPTRIL